MKTMKKLWVAASVAAISMTGCQEEQFEGRPDPDNYYASVETFGTDTRTALGEGRSVVWSSEDRITIFEGNGAGQAYQVLDAYVGKSSGEFAEVEGLVAEGTGNDIESTVAVYPFNEDLTATSGDNGNYIIEGITFPAVQKYIAGSFSDEAFPMTAVSPDGSKSLSFKNIGGVLKLSLTGNYSVSQITLTGNSGEPLSGPATVTLGPDGIPSVAMSDNVSKSVALICDPAVQLDPDTATDFYISIPPTEFEGGFNVTIYDSEGGSMSRNTYKTNAAYRSSIISMPSIEYIAGEYSEEDTDKAAKYVSESAFLVAEYVKRNHYGSYSLEDCQEIIAWLEKQDYVAEVEYDEYYKNIHSTFIDGTDFHVITEFDEDYALTNLTDTSENKLFKIKQETIYNIESSTNEVIQKNNKLLYIEGIPFDYKLYNELVKYITSPLNIVVTTAEGANDYARTNLNDFGAILIGKTHGTGKGKFMLEARLSEQFIYYYFINGVYRRRNTEGEFSFADGLIVSLKDIYSQNSNNPFVYANYCWSAEFNHDITGAFAGYYGMSDLRKNVDMSTQYFELLFNGSTHRSAFETLEPYLWKTKLLGGKWVYTMPMSYGEDNMRYFSISTYRPTIENGTAIVNGKINGYKNLKTSIKYKLYYREGKDEFSSPLENNVLSLDLKVANDGTIEQDIKENLEDNKEYTFRIGFEYNGNYYIGNSQSLNLTPPSERWIDLGLSVLWAECNVGAKSPEETGNYYAWGETQVQDTTTYGESIYFWNTYKHIEQLEYEHDHIEDEGKTCECWQYKFIGDDICGSSMDAATSNWGNGARMPTYDEIMELVEKCSFERRYGSNNLEIGRWVIGPNGNRIHLPYTGYISSGHNNGITHGGFLTTCNLWSGTLDEEGERAWALCSQPTGFWGYTYERFLGMPIRPVKDK